MKFKTISINFIRIKYIKNLNIIVQLKNGYIATN
jgi:hypothetical protein